MSAENRKQGKTEASQDVTGSGRRGPGPRDQVSSWIDDDDDDDDNDIEGDDECDDADGSLPSYAVPASQPQFSKQPHH